MWHAGSFPAVRLAHKPPLINTAQRRLNDQAATLGFRLVSFTITQKQISDPALNALPRADFQLMAAIARDMNIRLAATLADLETLVVK